MMRRFRDDEGNQIVQCGAYAYVWPAYYKLLIVGEEVLIDRGTVRDTELGSELGGAIGWIRGRAGRTR